MSGRDAILSELSEARYDSPPLPELSGFGGEYEDPIAQFESSLETVGGSLIRVARSVDLADALADLEVVRQAERLYSSLPAAVAGNVALSEIADPKELNNLGLAIVRGEWAVAENGAVWVNPTDLRHRAVLFIAEHLVLVVSESKLVHNMHQAYERLGANLPGYGLFISGPSKTADIEQSLVIGAQGPRSLHVCLVAGSDE